MSTVYDDQHPTGRPSTTTTTEDGNVLFLPQFTADGYLALSPATQAQLDRIEQMLGAVLGLVERPEKLVTHPYPSPSIWIAVGGRDDAPVYGAWATKEAAEKAQSEDPRGWVYEIVEWEVQP